MLLALCGPAGAGKSTAAAMLEGFERVRFAGPLKDMLRTLLTAADFEDFTIERMLDGDLKETPCGLFAGKTPRQVMQSLGTEWGRQMVNPDLWTDIATLRSLNNRMVFDDLRFWNEYDAIRKAGGKVIRVVRPNLEISVGHVSEIEHWPFGVDAEVVNDGTISQLREKIHAALVSLHE